MGRLGVDELIVMIRNIGKDVLELYEPRRNNGIQFNRRSKLKGFQIHPTNAFIPYYHLERGLTTSGQETLAHGGFANVVTNAPKTSYKVTHYSIVDPKAIEDRHFGDGFRMDTLESWERTVYENKRHNAKVDLIHKGPLIKEFQNMKDLVRYNIMDQFYDTLFALILEKSYFNTDQLVKYAVKHINSSMMGIKWSIFVERGQFTESYKLTVEGKKLHDALVFGIKSVCRQLSDKTTRSYIIDNELVVKHKYRGPAQRSRPGDVEPEDKKKMFEVIITKTRDRKAGLILLISHLMAYVKDEDKQEIYIKLYNVARNPIFSVTVSSTPEEHGMKFYEDIRDNDLIYADTSIAEKIEPMVAPDIFLVNDSEPGFPADRGDSKGSGGSTTRFIQFPAENALLNVLYDLDVIDKGTKIWQGGDNFAFDKEPNWNDLTDFIFGKSTRCLGHDIKGLQGYRITRDGVDNGIPLPRNFKTFTVQPTRIPKSALMMQFIGIGVIENIDYWSMFTNIPYDDDIRNFESSGPHARFEQFKLEMQPEKWDSVSNMLHDASNNIDYRIVDQVAYLHLENRKLL